MLTFAGGRIYWWAHQGDVKSIIYLNPMQEEALAKDDFDALEKLVSSVEKNGMRIENPEMRAGSYSYLVVEKTKAGVDADYTFKNGEKER